jgi:hypothetical protein
MADEDAQHALEVAAAYDQQPVKTFDADGSDETLAAFLGLSAWAAGAAGAPASRLGHVLGRGESRQDPHTDTCFGLDCR